MLATKHMKQAITPSFLKVQRIFGPTIKVQQHIFVLKKHLLAASGGSPACAQLT